jgi:hypothetical protein
MNRDSDETPALPLDELSITPQWIKSTGKSYDHYTGGESADREHPRGRRDRNRDRERGPRPPQTGKPNSSAAGKFEHRHDARPSAPVDRRVESSNRGRPPKGKSVPHGKDPRSRPEQRPAPAAVEVSFIPEEKGFTTMLDTLKQSTRAYAFFDIARLILNKPDRHLVKLACKPAADGTHPPLWLVLPSENPFLTRDEAIRFLIRRHTNLLWKEVQTPIDPPKGNFTFVNRCGFTGELLGPPNYHEYQSRIICHWKTRLAQQMSFDRFKARIETSKTPEAVEKWLQQMSSKTEFECRCCAPAPLVAAATGTPPSVSPADAPAEPAGDVTAISPATPEQPAHETPPPPAPEPAAAPQFATREEIEKHILANHLDKFITSATELQISGPASRRIADDGIHEAVRQAWETEWRFPLKTATGFQMRLRQDGFHFFKDRKGITYISRIRLKRFEIGQVFTENIQKIVLFLRTHEGATRKKLLAALAPATTAAPPTAASEAASATKATAPAPGSSPAAVPVPSPEEEQVLRDLHWLIADGFVVELFNGRLWVPPEKKSLPPPVPASTAAPMAASRPETPAVPVDGAAIISPQETVASQADAIPPESSPPAPTNESSPTSS